MTDITCAMQCNCGDESNDILTILISSEMVNPPPQEPPKRGRGRPAKKITDPDHYTTYRKEYYKKNAQHWNEYQKQWMKEKRRQSKIQKCIQFISDQVGKK